MFIIIMIIVVIVFSGGSSSDGGGGVLVTQEPCLAFPSALKKTESGQRQTLCLRRGSDPQMAQRWYSRYLFKEFEEQELV